MKTHLLIAIVLFLFILNSKAQTYFNLDYKNDSDNFNNGILIHPFSDTSGYLVVGSFPGVDARYLRFIRLNILGDTIWTKFYGKNNVIQFSTNGNYVNLGDTNFMFVGTIYADTINQTPDSTQTVLYKIDSAGNVLWDLKFGDSNKQTPPSDIKATADGGYIITGFTTGWSASNLVSSFLLKVDSNGVEEWHKIYGGGSYREAYSVEVTADNGYIMSGRFYQSTATDDDLNVIRTDSLGNVIWSQTYGTPEKDNAFTYITKYMNTGDYILTGGIDIDMGFGIDAQGYIARIDGTNGNVIWADSMGILQSGVWDLFNSNAIILPNGDIIGIGGTHYQLAVNTLDAWIVKYDGNGNLLWQRNFNKYGGANSNQNYFWDVHQTYDGGFILCGDLTNNAIPEQNLWVVKLDSNGCEIPNCSVGIAPQPSKGEISVYPNPNNGIFTIEQNDKGNATIEIYNIAGQLVQKTTLLNNYVNIDITAQSKGLYLLKVISNNQTITKRIIKY